MGQNKNKETDNLIQQLANATVTGARCGGHFKAKMNEQKAAEYVAALRIESKYIPSDDELYKIGIFNGEGAY